MKKEYIFTIITVVYNDSLNLERTILNVINQSFKNFQYIIIDGASNDETINVLEKYKKNIDILVSERDKGIYDAMNKGVTLSEGKWINFLNAGDTFIGNNFLQILAENIKNSISKIVNTGFIINDSIYKPCITKFYLLRNMPCHQSLFYKKEMFDDHKFNLEYKYCADFKHLIDVYEYNRIFTVKTVQVFYLGGGFSANKSVRKDILNERLKIILESNFNILYKVIFFLINRLQFLKTLF